MIFSVWYTKYERVYQMSIQSSLYKCYPYKLYNFIYVKKILFP